MSSHARELDVRPIPPPQRHPRIFQTFDSLSPGEGFVLINDHDPKPLLYQFQFERASSFDWNVLEAGPVVFRVEIRKRPSQTTRTITEYLHNDHKRLDAILEMVDKQAKAEDYPSAVCCYAEFSCGLTHHIDREEHVLFPVFEKATGMTQSGPTVVMRAEHAEIRHALAQLAQALENKDATGYEAARGSLMGVLAPHNVKEEDILYPTCDNLVGGDRDRSDLVNRIQAF